MRWEKKLGWITFVALGNALIYATSRLRHAMSDASGSLILEPAQNSDVATFIDEAGVRGYLRKLKQSGDSNIALLCSLPIPLELLDEVRSQIDVHYNNFCAAAPAGAKLHITDAYASGDVNWIAAADAARAGIFDVLTENRMLVVYAARRHRLAREIREEFEKIMQDAASKAAANGSSIFVRAGSQRVNNEQIDDRAIRDLALQLDMLLQNFRFNRTDLFFDQIDEPIKRRYEGFIERLKNQNERVIKSKIRNRQTGEIFERSTKIKISSGIDLNISRVGDITIAGKSEPMVFAVDVVANSLYRHLMSLPDTAPLHEQSSVRGWELEKLVYPNAPDGQSILDKI